jgi:hypothetical protein
MPRQSIEDRFNDKVDRSGDCWKWQAAKTQRGYGRFRFPWGHQLAHRFSYELANGPIPEDMFVCHSCDNPSCVNPDHLFLGTHADNMVDMKAKKRQARGAGHGRAKLTADDVENIRANSENLSGRQLAGIFGVSNVTIARILNRTIWTHV